MCLYACAIFRKPLCIFNIICIYKYIYIYIYICMITYVYVNIYKHLPLYRYVHLKLEIIYPKYPRIASNGKKCSRALFSTLFAKNQVFWKQSCFFQSKGLAGIYNTHIHIYNSTFIYFPLLSCILDRFKCHYYPAF